jgi:Uma2 family endonuclease
MSVEPPLHVEYPESDGEPMAETDWHVSEMMALIGSLQHRYRDAADVYVAGNNFVYYEEGNPKAVFSPDVYVVKGVQNKLRRVYKLWEEQQAPCFVMELSSRKTWLEDIGNKKALCARLGVDEYFLYDPEADVVKPPLQGFRLVEGDYRRIEPRPDGSVESKALGLVLRLDDQLRLRAVDARTGERLLRPEEARERAREAERERDQARRERDQAQREIARLRRELADCTGSDEEGGSSGSG